MTKAEMVQFALKSDDTVENTMWNIYQQGRADAIYEYKNKLIDDVSARAKAYEKVNDKHDAGIFNFATKSFIDALRYFDGRLKEKK